MTIANGDGSTSQEPEPEPEPDPNPTPDPTAYTVTWMANGSVHTTQSYALDGLGTLQLPTNPTPCSGWTFVGWIAESNYSNPFCPPAAYITAGSKVTANATYYAVFKKE